MKGGKPQVTSERVDPASQKFQDYTRSTAQGYVNSNKYGGPDPALTDAMGGLKQYSDTGQTAARYLGGDSSAAAQFMRPSLAGLDKMFDFQMSQAGRNADQDATRAGAFGGDRSQVGRAVAQTSISNNRAALGYQNENDSRSAALQAMNMGLGADTSRGELGKFMQFLPQLFQQGNMGILNGALGPTGKDTSTPTQSNPLGGLLGLAGTLLPILFPGAGGIAGGMLSGLAGTGVSPGMRAENIKWPTFGGK